MHQVRSDISPPTPDYIVSSLARSILEEEEEAQALLSFWATSPKGTTSWFLVVSAALLADRCRDELRLMQQLRQVMI